MELTDEQQARHSCGIQNNYGDVTNVYNLYLSLETNLIIKIGQIYIKNEFNGEIQELKVAHADVAVGVAEKGSNVFHHKEEKYERE